jgi:hypothetical protein
MASVIKAVSFDAADALALATFWAAALGSDVDEDSTADKAFVEAAAGADRTSGSLGFRRATSSASSPGQPPYHAGRDRWPR